MSKDHHESEDYKGSQTMKVKIQRAQLLQSQDTQGEDFQGRGDGILEMKQGLLNDEVASTHPHPIRLLPSINLECIFK